MPDFLTNAFAGAPAVAPGQVLLRLLGALVLGLGVAFIYTRTRQPGDQTGSFPPTLVLLSVLIAMVTQVIGDNVARAFSLVGALSIVRFRTVVRDTQDTAFVIFAVVVGMAIGASDVWVALVGMAVVTAAAFITRRSPTASLANGSRSFTLQLRVGLGHDLATAIAPTVDKHFKGKRLVTLGTARQGLAVDVTYEGELAAGSSAEELILELNRLEGVQMAELKARGTEEEAV